MLLIVNSNLVSMPSLFSCDAKANSQQGIRVHYVLMVGDITLFEYETVAATFIPNVYDSIMQNGYCTLQCKCPYTTIKHVFSHTCTSMHVSDLRT